MSHTTKITVWRDLGCLWEFDVTVEYSASRYYPATWDGPAEVGEIEITGAWTADGLPFSWTHDQDQAWSEWISENHDYNDDRRDPDAAYDAWRDAKMDRM
jgi:hypothetical protein